MAVDLFYICMSVQYTYLYLYKVIHIYKETSKEVIIMIIAVVNWLVDACLFGILSRCG